MGLGTRTIRKELLDELSASDPAAIRSRRDLRRVNTWMGNARLVAHCEKPPRPGSRIIELGAGDGTFLLAVARRWGVREIEATLVDQRELMAVETKEALAELHWKVRVETADVFEWLEAQPASVADLFLANLFLHHFTAEQLKRLLELIACRTQMLIACEPARSRFGRLGVQLLPLIGCNRVTRHDAGLSVSAGFAGRELSDLWPAGGGWILREGSANLFSHLFYARRQS